jgi:ribose transport system permease protein
VSTTSQLRDRRAASAAAPAAEEDERRLTEGTTAAPDLLPGASKWIDLRWRVAPFAVAWGTTLVLIVISVIVFPSDLRFGSLATLTPLIGVLVLTALGQSLVIGTGGIDLSAASVVTLAGVELVGISHGHNSSLPQAIVGVLVAGAVCGTVNGFLVEYLNLSALVGTLATAEIILGLATVWYGTGGSAAAAPSSWQHLTGRTVGGVSDILIAAVILAILLSGLLTRTTTGRRLTAASVSVPASRYQGIRYRRYRFSTYVIAGVCYAAGGLLLAGEIGSPTLSLGDPYQLETIVAVVLGGASLTGGRLHPGATVAGAFFLAVIDQDVATAGLTTGTQDFVQGLVIIAAVTATLVGTLPLIRRRRLRRSLEHTAGQAPPGRSAGDPLVPPAPLTAETP